MLIKKICQNEEDVNGLWELLLFAKIIKNHQRSTLKKNRTKY